MKKLLKNVELLNTMSYREFIEAVIYKEAVEYDIFSNTFKAKPVTQEECVKIVKKVADRYDEDQEISLLHRELMDTLWCEVGEPI